MLENLGRASIRSSARETKDARVYTYTESADHLHAVEWLLPVKNSRSSLGDYSRVSLIAAVMIGPRGNVVGKGMMSLLSAANCLRGVDKGVYLDGRIITQPPFKRGDLQGD